MIQDRGKVTVGVTLDGAKNLAALMAIDEGWFDSEMAAYLLAITTALSHGLAVQQGPLVGVTTKWNVGSLDSDGRLRDLMRLLGPAEARDPYEVAEKLADAGLGFLKRRLVDEDRMLSDVLSPAPPEDPT